MASIRIDMPKKYPPDVSSPIRCQLPSRKKIGSHASKAMTTSRQNIHQISLRSYFIATDQQCKARCRQSYRSSHPLASETRSFSRSHSVAQCSGVAVFQLMWPHPLCPLHGRIAHTFEEKSNRERKRRIEKIDRLAFRVTYRIERRSILVPSRENGGSFTADTLIRSFGRI